MRGIDLPTKNIHVARTRETSRGKRDYPYQSYLRCHCGMVLAAIQKVLLFAFIWDMTYATMH